ncbi:MAG: hypothetical protein ACE5E5_07360 [Phycisphaerae bacterium]
MPGQLKLTRAQILQWADAHHRRTGHWPHRRSGTIYGRRFEKWSLIDDLLSRGGFGWPGGSSLEAFLWTHRKKHDRPPLTIRKILSWADRYHQRTQRWPTAKLLHVREAPGESWTEIDKCLRQGGRGLDGGASLDQLLAERRGVQRRRKRPNLTLKRILQWADQYHEQHGSWPGAPSGNIPGSDGDYWSTVDRHLKEGGRGLPGGDSLTELLVRRRGHINPANRPRLTIKQVLRWADRHHRRTGHWPKNSSGAVVGAPGETWAAIDQCLRQGLRGLPAGSSLNRRLIKHRGIERERKLTIRQILQWADAYHQRTGRWPLTTEEPVAPDRSETWAMVRYALARGSRGLPGDTSLSRLLAKHRGIRSLADRPRLTIRQILRWADQHHARTGQWPSVRSGKIPNADGDTWVAVQGALQNGIRGLPKGLTLPQVLGKYRNVPNPKKPQRLTLKQILQWADRHHKRTGQWPKARSGGAIPGVNWIDWAGVNRALYLGIRGLPGGSSLPRLLEQRRGVRNPAGLERLTIKRILQWADAYHKRHGTWPHQHSGPISGAKGETWKRIDTALIVGVRGLPGGSSLAKLLEKQRGARHRQFPPKLTIKQILQWADRYHRTYKTWPSDRSGPIKGVDGETWRTVNQALVDGRRGLRGGSSLAKVLDRHRR